MSAPSVNQMRLFKSSAFAKAPKLRLAASCSAAETMSAPLPPCPYMGSVLRFAARRFRGRGFLRFLRLRFFLRLFLRLLGLGLLGRALRLRRRQPLDRAAEFFDRRRRRFRSAMHLEGDLGLEFAAAEQPHAVERAVQDAGRDQRLGRHRLSRVEPALVDRGLHAAEIHFVQVKREDIGETALRQPAMDRHLSAFEALDAHARARLLALDAAAAGLALARADAASDPLSETARTGAVRDLIEFHWTLT